MSGDRSRAITHKLSRGLGDWIGRIARSTDLRLGDPQRPLLLAIRCSPAGAMPGLMPPVLNVGMNPSMAEAMAKEDPRFAYDCFGRLICGMGVAVEGIGQGRFEEALGSIFADAPADGPTVEQMPRGVEALLGVWRDAGKVFISDPIAQVIRCIEAARASWDSPIAQAYRRKNGIADAGMAVIVQAMVYGNRDERSGVGRMLTRDAATGEGRVSGQFTAGVQETDPWQGHAVSLDAIDTGIGRELQRLKKRIERQVGDACDVEFVAENKRVFVLNCRPMARTPAAAARIAVDLVRQRIISRREAVLRLEPSQVEQMLHPRLDTAGAGESIACGSAASPGAAVGRLAFSAAEAEARAKAGEQVILVRRETDASDIGGMQYCEGFLTSTGGMTSHAAVVARGMGKPCISGAAELRIDEAGRHVEIDGTTYGEDDWFSIDGSRGEVYAGQLPTVQPEMGSALRALLSWADGFRTLGIRANADTPQDAAAARAAGAEGIGLCRTEHMFFDPQRIHAMRRMILADTPEAREVALANLLPYQREDFVGIFKAMAGLPVTIRLLDPPLHEFLPRDAKDQQALADEMGLSLEQVRQRIDRLAEMNPMLGHRGCRLAISHPEILRMQVRAIMEAAAICRKEKIKVLPEIMIPLVMAAGELECLKGDITDFRLGVMIETPRAALVAGELARDAEFFSFGTNDLTQLTYGISRDDAGRFLPEYVQKGVFPADPFAGLDQSGVGELMRMALASGRLAHPGLKCGLCGEHGGDPASIDFCHRIGLDYVSCSPHRLPIARLAAAQAAIRAGNSVMHAR